MSVGVAAPESPVVGVAVDDGSGVAVAVGDAEVLPVLVVFEFVIFDVSLLHPVRIAIAAASVIAVIAAKRILIFNLLIESQPPNVYG
jgi:hypothetical protein